MEGFQFDSCIIPNVQSQMNQSLSTLLYYPFRPFSFSTFLFPHTYLIEGVFIYLGRFSFMTLCWIIIVILNESNGLLCLAHAIE